MRRCLPWVVLLLGLIVMSLRHTAGSLSGLAVFDGSVAQAQDEDEDSDEESDEDTEDDDDAEDDDDDDDEEDEEDKIPDIEDYTRDEWVHLHLRMTHNRRIPQQCLACMEAAWLNDPRFVPDLLAIIQNSRKDRRVVNFALHALSKMEHKTLVIGAGPGLMDTIIARFIDLTAKTPYGKDKVGIIVRLLSNQKSLEADRGKISTWWKKQKESFTKYTEKLQKEYKDEQARIREEDKKAAENNPDATPTQRTPRANEKTANPYSQVFYYGKHPLDLFFYIDIAPVNQQMDWDLPINIECANLMGLLGQLAPDFRIGMVTFGDTDFGHMPITVDLYDAQQVIRQVRYGVQAATQSARGFALSLEWTRKNTDWAKDGRRVAVAVADQEGGAESAVNVLRELVKQCEFDQLHVAGHYNIELDPEPAPPIFRKLAKEFNGQATYERKIDQLLPFILPLVYTDDPAAAKEIETFAWEIIRVYLESKPPYPTLGPKNTGNTGGGSGGN